MYAEATLEKKALDDLTALVAPGPRFHGTPGIEVAADFLQERLTALGLEVSSTEVRTPGWDAGTTTLDIEAPLARRLNSWPMLWSGSSVDPIRATLRPHGEQGLWADSQTWTKFAAERNGKVVAYIHARDNGPAAPQPLPVGSDETVPHIAIGRIDGMQLSEWINDGFEVAVSVQATSTSTPEAVSQNLSVRIPGRTGGGPKHVLVCGHYDTFWNTPGAYDNGSGTVALLLLAEQWLIEPPRQDVVITFFTAEEWHLAGSRAMVAKSSRAELDAIDYVINIDGLGPGDFMESSTGPEAFDDAVTEQIRSFGARSRQRLRVLSRFPPTCGTDHVAFYSAGVPSAHITFNDPHRLHQPNDHPTPAIASNIAWTVELVKHLVESLEKPARPNVSRGISMPF